MAQPSSERERDRDRSERHRNSGSHHHHHRTISSTTLLLALSLILAVLAITLTIPSYSNSSNSAESASGIMGYLTPKRATGLIAREGAVALREAEVARREAELLIGSPVGVAVPSALAAAPVPAGCPPGTLQIVTQTVTLEMIPTGGVVREVVREVEAIAAPPVNYADARIDNLHHREAKVSDREREVGGREEVVGKRETDAARREQWIMDQLVKLGNDKVVEEEVVYEAPRKKKAQKPRQMPEMQDPPQPSQPSQHRPSNNQPIKPPHPLQPSQPSQPSQFQKRPQYVQDDDQPEPENPEFRHGAPVTMTPVLDDPSATRLAAQPKPVSFSEPTAPYIGKTTEYEVIMDETDAPGIPRATQGLPVHDGHYDAHYDPRHDAQYDPRHDPQYDPRRDPQYDPRRDPQYDPRRDPQYDPRHDPQYEQYHPHDQYQQYEQEHEQEQPRFSPPTIGDEDDQGEEEDEPSVKTIRRKTVSARPRPTRWLW